MAFVFDPAAENRELARLAEMGQLPDILRDTNLAGVMTDIDCVGTSVISDAFSEATKFSESTKLAAGLLGEQTSALASVAALDLAIPNPAEEASKVLAGYVMTGAADVINREMTELSAGIQVLEESQLFGKRLLDELSPAAKLSKFAAGVTDILPRELAKFSASFFALVDSRRVGKKMLDDLSGASALSQLAAGLLDHPPFDDACATAMRQALGDWRDIAAFPEPLLDAPLARGEFYYGLGFDRALTDLPTPAYMDMLDAVDLRIPRHPEPALYRQYLPELDEPADDVDDADTISALNHDAYRQLVTLERNLRVFIDSCMCAAFGPAWLRERMQDLHDRLQEKRDKDIAAGRDPARLIDYADFTDYERVILRRDHWQRVFKGYFRNQDDIKVSFLRLYPARHCTMHGRVVTRNDHLLVSSEVQQILRAIRRRGINRGGR